MMNISIFKNMTSKLPLPGLLEGVANLIRSDEHLKAFTAYYRQTGNKQYKQECPLFAVACLFEGGKGQDNIKRLTGLSLVDFDHIVGSEERRGKSEETTFDDQRESQSNSKDTAQILAYLHSSVDRAIQRCSIAYT